MSFLHHKIWWHTSLIMQHCLKTIEKWIKGCILSFLKKDDLKITKNYRDITLTAKATKLYNVLPLDHIWRNWSTTSQIQTIHWIIKAVCAKYIKATLLLVDFPKAFDSLEKKKMEQILRAYGLPIETVTTIILLYENMKAMGCSSFGGTDFLSIGTFCSVGWDCRIHRVHLYTGVRLLQQVSW